MMNAIGGFENRSLGQLPTNSLPPSLPSEIAPRWPQDGLRNHPDTQTLVSPPSAPLGFAALVRQATRPRRACIRISLYMYIWLCTCNTNVNNNVIKNNNHKFLILITRESKHCDIQFNNQRIFLNFRLKFKNMFYKLYNLSQ